MLSSCTLNKALFPYTEKNISVAQMNIKLGLSYLNQGDRLRAKTKLLKAYQLAPNLPETNAALGLYFEKTGKIVEAKPYYQRSINLAPKAGAYLNNYAIYLCRQGFYKEADHFFLEAFKDIHYLNSASLYENAGLCAIKRLDYPKARHYFSRALKENPLQKQALYQWVKLEMHLKKTEKAKALLTRYQDLVKTDPKLQAMALRVLQKKWSKS